MQVSTVTVGVDGSASSETALDWVIDRAGAVPTALELVSVIPPREAEWGDLAAGRVFHEEVLTRAAERARAGASFESVSTSLRSGVVVRMLLDSAARTDLLVVGTDRTSLLRHLSYGTVPLRLAALAVSPLVVVPRRWTAGSGPIVLAVGETTPSAAAIAFAEGEARRADDAVDLVHVWAALPAFPGPVFVVEYPSEAIEQSGQLVLWATSSLIHGLHPGLTVRRTLVEGSTIPRLVDASRHARLLVVGREERGLLLDIIRLGSVAHDMLLNPASPIAVVPARRLGASLAPSGEAQLSTV